MLSITITSLGLLGGLVDFIVNWAKPVSWKLRSKEISQEGEPADDTDTRKTEADQCYGSGEDLQHVIAPGVETEWEEPD